ncbi:glycosyltransferase family 4 protein [Candidatus Saccharibacteria bacterium]|jgi:glycosyltransferase involved in cell wall biosynthesis|nr:glycosyltransferase family 4 protein [Candidatus Saccharibacteria bacterium]HOR23072.1 glycosyltransferase family 1 protein [Candidatus Saccharibacteria bacterium]
MARIAIDARELSTSTGRYVSKLLEYLQKLDPNNEYMVLLKPDDFKKWRPTAKNFKKVLCPHQEFSTDEQFAFKKQLEELNPDLVHFAMVQQPVWYKGKVVTTVHDLTATRFKNPSKNKIVFSFKQQIYKWVIKKAVKKSILVITPSKFVKKDLIKFTGVNPNKIVVTYESADEFTEPSTPVKSVQSKQFIFYVGRAQPHKNLPKLMEVFAMLRQDNPSLYLVLAGRKDKTYDSLMEEAKNYGVDGFVIFTGYVTDGQLKWLYRGCRAYVFPSLSEGFGLPGLEAMLHRAPVVSSTATCLPEIYGKAAWYFNPQDKYDMERSIKAVLNDKALRSKLIIAGRAQAQKYSWERMAKQTLKVYELALKK